MTTHFHRVLMIGAFCAFAGTSFAQVGNNGNGGNRPNMGNMTSAQRDAMRAQMRELQIRTALASAGFEDAAIQDSVIALAKQEQTTATGFIPKINAIRAAFQNNTDDNTVSGLLADFRRSVADAQNARAAAITALDNSISFSTKPKLEALLTMLGIIGDESGFAANLAGQAQLPGSTGNRDGGPGGGMGGSGGNMGRGPGGMGADTGGMMPPPPPGQN